MKGARPTAIAAIDALKPYKGGNDQLWCLHKLNNVDKHRVLITAGSAFRSVNIGPRLVRDLKELHATSPIFSDLENKIPIPTLFLKPVDRMFPLMPGTELFTDLPNAEPCEEMQFRFEIAFCEKGVADGVSIIETISSMVTLIENIVPQFEQHLS